MASPHVETAGAVATSTEIDGEHSVVAKTSYGFGMMVNKVEGAFGHNVIVSAV